MHDATVETTGTRPVLRFVRELSRPPAEVWRSLTEPDELAAWFPGDIVVEQWRVGAPLRFVFREAEGDDLEGTVLECEEPRLLAYTWGPETLRFELTEVPGGTRLVLTDELDAPTTARNAAGWEVCLELLEGRPPAADLWRSRFDHYVEALVPALGPQEGPPQRPS